MPPKPCRHVPEYNPRTGAKNPGWLPRVRCGCADCKRFVRESMGTIREVREAISIANDTETLERMRRQDEARAKGRKMFEREWAVAVLAGDYGPAQEAFAKNQLLDPFGSTDEIQRIRELITVRRIPRRKVKGSGGATRLGERRQVEGPDR